MFTVNQSFNLKRSRLALVFQLCIFVLLSVLLYIALPLWLWGIAMFAAIVAYALGLRLPPEIQLEHLDERDWTLSGREPRTVKLVQISHVVDHQLYVVVYFQHFREKPLLIWCDQLSWQEWKDLKMLTKLQ